MCKSTQGETSWRGERLSDGSIAADRASAGMAREDKELRGFEGVMFDASRRALFFL